MEPAANNNSLNPDKNLTGRKAELAGQDNVPPNQDRNELTDLKHPTATPANRATPGIIPATVADELLERIRRLTVDIPHAPIPPPPDAAIYDFSDEPRARFVDGWHLAHSFWDDLVALAKGALLFAKHRYSDLRLIASFGSARTGPDHPVYEQVREFNREFVARDSRNGVVTGGGPGVMEAANRGAKDAIDAGQSDAVSIGIKILLPSSKMEEEDSRRVGGTARIEERRKGGNDFEQEANKFLTHLFNFHYFPNRRSLLLRCADAVVSFVGGYGTLDETFEALTLKARGYTKPILLMGKDFWGGLDRWLKDLHGKFRLIKQDPASLYDVVDSKEKALSVLDAKLAKRPASDTATGPLTALRTAWELLRGMRKLHFVGPCVLMTGSECVEGRSPWAEAMRKIGCALSIAVRNSNFAGQPRSSIESQNKYPAFNIITFGRSGIDKIVNQAVEEHCKSKQRPNRSMAVFYKGHDGDLQPNQYLDRCVQFKSYPSMKVMAVKYSPAIVLGPPDLQTLDLLFEVLTGIQTKKIEPRPIVLVGKEVWQPLFNWIREEMRDRHQTINPEDLNLVKITDDADEAVDYIRRETNRSRLMAHYFKGTPIAALGEQGLSPVRRR